MKYTDTQTTVGLLSSACSPIPAGALLPADLLTELIKGIFMLDPELRDVVGLRFLGATYREIGEQLGISTQLAEMRHKRALRDWPALRPLFPEKIVKRARRKSQ
ncbi:hypothetical protein PDESU_05060 [Pontiella desulfatans]|uniref:RNA polymerase sigma-70 region 4 domain-containing protein n=1 Tax=Pontiella desulfatans TaxID=2750659 RepID=A0A6C2U9A4_PONDE|nr:sigma factor-like helix-turn-helix DNA-binding protein [Pontiella desulfatans]VGO16469.1 hypothetical protein PDESU_05060 [Pontiella desulfatans]